MEKKKQEVATTPEKAQAGLVVNNAFVDGLVSQLQQKEKYGLTFPDGYNYSNELMGAYLVLKGTVDRNKKPVLQSCSQASIANTLMDMVTMGVSMQKKQCYPVAYGGKLQCQVSVYGNTCIARRYGLRDIDAMCIYSGDEFSYHIENARIVIDCHKQDFLNIAPEKIIGAYAVVSMNDGSKYVEIMNMAMIKQAWKQGFGYSESKDGTHQKFTDQMAMKTVKNRALKYIIRTYGTQAVSDTIDDVEVSESEDRVALNAQYEISENANIVDFDAEVDAAEVINVDDASEEKDPEDEEVPDFMKS